VEEAVIWKQVAAKGAQRARDVLITVCALGMYAGFFVFASV
jgi:hypothetical protein